MMLLSVVRCPPFLSDRTLHCEWGIRITIDFRASLNRRVQKILTTTHEKKQRSTQHKSNTRFSVPAMQAIGWNKAVVALC